MILMVISDLHIGNGDSFSTFGWDADEFITTIENYRKHFSVDKIILNGDIYELYKYSKGEIVANNLKLIHYLQRDYFYYINGNHDLKWADGSDYFLTFNSQGQSVYIEHGHHADFMNGSLLGQIISKTGFILLKYLIANWSILKLYHRIVEYDDEINHIPKKYNSIGYLKYALKLLKKYDMVVLGHTHKIETHNTYYLNRKKIYLNSGSCSLGRFESLLINTETFKYETIKIRKKGNVKAALKIKAIA